jgi:hypothetical protein
MYMDLHNLSLSINFQSFFYRLSTYTFNHRYLHLSNNCYVQTNALGNLMLLEIMYIINFPHAWISTEYHQCQLLSICCMCRALCFLHRVVWLSIWNSRVLPRFVLGLLLGGGDRVAQFLVYCVCVVFVYY